MSILYVYIIKEIKQTGREKKSERMKWTEDKYTLGWKFKKRINMDFKYILLSGYLNQKAVIKDAGE